MPRMSPADAVWYLGETPQNSMIVSSLLWFDGPVDLVALKRTLADRVIAKHPVFSQRITRSAVPGMLPRWEDDPDFDLDNHIVVEALPAPGDQDQVQRRVSEQRSTPMNPARSPWRWHVMTGYRGQGTVAHVRFHHSIGDGWALVRLLLTLVDDADGHRDESVPVVDDDPHPTLHAAEHLVEAAAGTLLHPSHWLGAAQAGLDQVRWSARLLAPPMPTRTALMGHPSGLKRVVWDAEGMPLGDLKEVGRAHDATINDVLLATLAEALHRHLAEQGTPADEALVMAPIALRRADEPLHRHLGNRIGLLPCLLPTGDATVVERLRLVRQRTTELKRSRAPAVSWALLTATSLLTPPLERAIHRANQLRGTGVVTNVPGPRTPVSLAGAPVGGMLGWGGMTANLNLSWAFFSLGDRVFQGAITDEAITPDPGRLLHLFGDAWLDLHQLA